MTASSSVVVEEEQGHREEEEQESFLVNHSSFSHQYFEDEGYYIPHSSAGLVSMISNGVDENGSCFAITTAACPQVDGRFVCFGRVINKEGMEIVTKISEVYSMRGVPSSSIIIKKCGIEK